MIYKNFIIEYAYGRGYDAYDMTDCDAIPLHDYSKKGLREQIDEKRLEECEYYHHLIEKRIYFNE